MDHIFKNHFNREKGLACARSALDSVISRIRGSLGAIELSISSYSSVNEKNSELHCIESALSEIKQIISDHTSHKEMSLELELASPIDPILQGIEDCYPLMSQRQIELTLNKSQSIVPIWLDKTLLRQLTVHCILFLSAIIDDHTEITIDLNNISKHFTIQFKSLTESYNCLTIEEHINNEINLNSQLFSDFARIHELTQFHQGAVDISEPIDGLPEINIFIPHKHQLNHTTTIY